MIAYEERKHFLSVIKNVIKCNFEEKISHQLGINL